MECQSAADEGILIDPNSDQTFLTQGCQDALLPCTEATSSDMPGECCADCSNCPQGSYEDGECCSGYKCAEGSALPPFSNHFV